MKTQLYLLLITWSMVIAKDISITERRGVLDERTDHRTGDYGLICQNENGTYNPDMENYVYSPMIDIPEGEQVSVDFLFKGSILDSDDFPEVDYWNMQVSPDSGSTWFYCSNPYGDTTGTFPNYVFTDAPELWALFSTYYNEPIDLDNYAGISLQFRYWFHSDSDAPQGEGLFIDDISIDVDGSNVYFESFEDSTMAGWVSVDQTRTLLGIRIHMVPMVALVSHGGWAILLSAQMVDIWTIGIRF